MADPATDIPLAEFTTLRLGGPADRLVRVGDEDELVRIAREADAAGERLFLLAGGSNVVIADEGVRGTTALIETKGLELREAGDGRVAVTAAAGETWDGLVAETVKRGLAGLECLSGIPGSAGATPIQNVGAYGQEVASTIESVRALDRHSGEVVELGNAECGFTYRHSRFKGNDGHLILEVTFLLERSGLSQPVAYGQLAGALGVEVGQRVPLVDARDKVLELRRSKSMVIDPKDPDSVSAGSFFTNPILPEAEMEAFRARAADLLGPEDAPPAYPSPEGTVKTSAAWLIERAGFHRGYGEGPIGLSRNHTLALVNRGGGTTAELVGFAHGIADRVEEVFGIPLVPEPVFVGHHW